LGGRADAGKLKHHIRKMEIISANEVKKHEKIFFKKKRKEKEKRKQQKQISRLKFCQWLKKS